MSSASSQSKPFNLFAFPFGSGQINPGSFETQRQHSYISFRGVPEDNLNEPRSYAPPTSLEHKPPSMVQFTPSVSTVASFEIVKATKEPLATDKPTLKRLIISACRTDEIEEIQPFTPGYTDKVKGWSASCRNSPVVETVPRAAPDQKEKQIPEKTQVLQPAHRDSFRPRTLSTHQADLEALSQLQDIRSGDQTLLVLMDQSALEARRARHRDDSCDKDALKSQGFLTT